MIAVDEDSVKPFDPPFEKLLKTKQALDETLLQAFKINGKSKLKQTFHELSLLQNDLRRCYNLPLTRSNSELTVLKSTQEYMLSCDVGHRTMMGRAVVNNLETPIATSENSVRSKAWNESMFAKAFTSPVYAKSFEERALYVSDQKLATKKNVIVLPPLLMRSDQNGSLRFRLVGKQLMRTDDPYQSQILLVMFEEGAIIPVIRKSMTKRIVPRLHHWYSKEGHTNAEYFMENFV